MGKFKTGLNEKCKKIGKWAKIRLGKFKAVYSSLAVLFLQVAEDSQMH